MATDATAIIAIPEALLETAATRHFEGTLDLAELAAGPDTYTFAAPVSWSVEATNTGDAILVQGTAAGDATTQCARCLEDVTYGLEGDIEGYFLIGGAPVLYYGFVMTACACVTGTFTGLCAQYAVKRFGIMSD